MGPLRLILIAALALAAPLFARAAPVPSETYLEPATLVEVEPGRRLNMLCMGDGDLVVLEAGMGDSNVAWRNLQAQLASFAKVCSYDRAGYGHSDPATRPSTAMNAVDDLKRLIVSSKSSTPFVLVGHSLGGLYATLYADLHLEDLRGLVLVDPVYAEQGSQMDAALTDELRTRARQATKAGLDAKRECVRLAASGALATGHGPRQCLDDPKREDRVLHEMLNRQYARERTQAGGLSEAESFVAPDGDAPSLSAQQEIASRRTFGALPVVVLGRVKGSPPPGLDAAVYAKMVAAEEAGFDALAARSTRGEVVRVKTGHYIQHEAPEVIVDVVRRMLATSGR